MFTDFTNQVRSRDIFAQTSEPVASPSAGDLGEYRFQALWLGLHFLDPVTMSALRSMACLDFAVYEVSVLSLISLWIFAVTFVFLFDSSLPFSSLFLFSFWGLSVYLLPAFGCLPALLVHLLTFLFVFLESHYICTAPIPASS